MPCTEKKIKKNINFKKERSFLHQRAHQQAVFPVLSVSKAESK